MSILFLALSAWGLRSLVESFLSKFAEVTSTCPKKHMEKNKFESICFHHFPIMSKKYPPFCQKRFSRVVRNAFYVSRRKVWGKRNSNWEKLFSPLCPLIENIWVLPQNNFGKLIKTAFYMPRYFFSGKTLWWTQNGTDITERWQKPLSPTKIYRGGPFDISESFWIRWFLPKAGITIVFQNFVVPQ